MKELPRFPVFSVITVVRNRQSEIARTIQSVGSQTLASSIEHIIYDGASVDDTVFVAEQTHSLAEKVIISEPDEGIYDALNKAFSVARGRYIAVLHSDDIFNDERVLEDILGIFVSEDADIVYADSKVVDECGRVVGHVRPSRRAGRWLFPDQVSHEAIFFTSDVARQLTPPFDTSYKIAADLKQQLLILDKRQNLACYFDRVVVVFRMGGESTRSWKAYLTGLIEARRAWNDVNGRFGTFYCLSKILIRLGRRFA